MEKKVAVSFLDQMIIMMISIEGIISPINNIEIYPNLVKTSITEENAYQLISSLFMSLKSKNTEFLCSNHE